MKLLLTLTAVFEALTGIGLIVFPSMVISLLIGPLPDGAVVLTLARIAGAALISLAIACWLLRNNVTAMGIVKAMLFYNLAATASLLYASIGDKLSGTGLWPAILLHAGLAVWCFIALSQPKEILKNI
jgi:hypothetical protein